jgi:hypothetical protein
MQLAAGGIDLNAIKQIQGGVAETLKSFEVTDKAALAAMGMARLSSARQVAEEFDAINRGSVKHAYEAATGLRNLGMPPDITGGAAGLNAVSSAKQLAARLDEQFKAIDALRLPPAEMPRLREPTYRPPVMPVVKNPLIETNKRLQNIEVRFDKIGEIALNAAEIATSLQASAATFLDKFEAAAKDNDKTTKRAIWIGVIAIFVAILIPLLQSAYAELVRAPADATAMQQAISDIKGEIKGLHDANALVSDKIAKTLSEHNADATQTLREIRDLLAQQKTTPAPSSPLSR